jgi:N utilization substance protein B
MKKKSDPRHISRVKTMQTLFESNFRQRYKTDGKNEASQILESKSKIDRLIQKNAPAWPIKQIAPVDIAILRLAIWELIFKKRKEPYKVIVDEAVEIAKEYGSESSAGFINGVLGSVIKAQIKS